MKTSPIAILGLSADPPHTGHLEASRYVYELGYSRVWWMISPQNPAKHTALASYVHRRELARLLARGEEDWLEISDFEAGMTVQEPSVRTFALLSHLRHVFPSTPFTFVMGADNWADPATGFHTWGHYTEILDLVGILVLPREPWNTAVESCPASHQFAAQRNTDFDVVVPQGQWRIAPHQPNPKIDLEHLSSTEIREQLLADASPHLTEAQNIYINMHGLYA